LLPKVKEHQRIGPYEIIGPLGAGGMGEVYRARDPRLNREVALKILPGDVARDQGRRRRFLEEARAAGGLSHPNVLAVYDVGVGAGTPFIVSELLDGRQLRDEIDQGPLPLSRLLDLGVQMAAGLSAAHAAGLVHRDLKPENVVVTRDGRVKIVDFGLAKAYAASAEGIGRGAATLTLPGTLVGTPHYMSPEQASGGSVDFRSDQFSLGVILYEMATGVQPFRRETPVQTMSAIVADDVRPIAELNAKTPQVLHWIIERCLAKAPDDRYASTTDLARDLTTLQRRLPEVSGPERSARVSEHARNVALPVGVIRDMATVGSIMDGAFETASDGQSREQRTRTALRSRAWWRWTAVLVIGVVAILVAWTARPVERPRVSRFVLPVDTRARFDPSVPAISPDGQYLAYTWGPVGNRTLSLHRMADPEGAPLAEFVGATHPFFSPDSAWLGFFAGGELRKVSVLGGTAQTLARANAGRGASWGDDNRIVFAPSFRSALLRVSADGGAPETVTSLDLHFDESGHRRPQVLPGSRAVVFTAVRTRGDALIVVSLKTGERRLTIEGAGFGRYVSTGHLVYLQEGRLMAAPFDIGRLAAVGPAVPVLDAGPPPTDSLSFEGTDAGLLAYRSGSAATSTLVWVDRAGIVTPFARALRGFAHPRVSPDGQRIVASREQDLWVYDLARDALSQLTFQGGSFPVWTPDGRQVIYGRPRPRTGWDIFWKPADGSGSEQELLARPLDQAPSGGNPSLDGHLLPFVEWSLETAADIHLLSMKDGADRVLVKSPEFELNASLSPDARYIAYVSTELGTPEVFIRPVIGEGGVRRVSAEGGVEPHWSPSGEIFFRSGTRVLAVNVRTQPDLVVGTPRALFEGPYVLSAIWDRNYDVTADGQRFLMVRQADAGDSTVQLNIVVNWFEELKEKTR
jgi:eukaryotic-like serine/threonine-protein kinase